MRDIKLRRKKASGKNILNKNILNKNILNKNMFGKEVVSKEVSGNRSPSQCCQRLNWQSINLSLLGIIAAAFWIFSTCQVLAADTGNSRFQAVETPPTQAPPDPAYQIAPNDQLAISVQNHPDLSLSESVRADGKIYIPSLGDLAVGGQTLIHVRDEIARRLTTYLRNPDVNVVIVSYHRENIYVVGSVRSFGTFAYTRGMSAEESLSLAGGPDDMADLEHVKIVRHHKTAAVLDLTNGVSDTSRRFPLQPEDMVYIPKLPEQAITLVGSLPNPGTRPLHTHERLLDALASAGVSQAAAGGTSIGPGREGDLSHITLTRGAEIRTIDGLAVLQGSQELNLLLQPGDVIYVPPAARVMVVGAVQRSGSQTLAPGERLLDAINAAGISTSEHGVPTTASPVGSAAAEAPDLAHVTLTRTGKVQTIDAGAILKGSLQDNLVLEPGDLIYVPPAARITVVGDVQRSGAQPLAPGERILDAINAAGIPTGDRGAPLAAGNNGQAAAPDLAHVTLTRGGKLQTIDVSAMLKGSLQDNVELEAEDVIYVPPAARITVVGEVQRPGSQALSPGERLLDVLIGAGIPAGESTTLVSASGHTDTPSSGPDLAHVTLTRAGKVQVIDVGAILKGVLQDNLLVEPGDVIYVPSQHPGTVTVLGEVNRPQTMRLVPGSHVLDLLNTAGGLNPHADPQHVTLQRLGSPPQVLDMKSLLAGKDTSQNVALQEGDVLTVPVNHLQVLVLGQVGRPGIVDFNQGDDVLQATLLAGGTTTTASLKDVGLVRSGKDGNPQHLKIDLGQIIKTGNRNTDQTLTPGDIIYVPAKGQSGSILTSVAGWLGFARLLIP